MDLGNISKIYTILSHTTEDGNGKLPFHDDVRYFRSEYEGHGSDRFLAQILYVYT